MNECFVTKLPFRANDEHLRCLGEIKIKLLPGNNTTTENIKPSITSSVEQKVTITGGTFYDGSTELTIPAGVSTKISGSDNAIVSIPNKYAITTIKGYLFSILENLSTFKSCESLVNITNYWTDENLCGDIAGLRNSSLTNVYLEGAPNIDGDIAELAGITTLTQIYINRNLSIYGSFSSFASRTNLTKLDISAPIVGDIANLANSISLTTLRCGSGEGSFEALVEGQWRNGRRSGTVEVLSSGSSITLNGNSVRNDNKYYFVFSNSGVSIHYITSEGVIKASFDGSNWSYQA